MAKVEPITPNNVVGKQQEILPDDVIEKWNDLIARHWNGNESRITVTEAKNTLSALGSPPAHWLDIEPIYREAGWSVHFDKPGYNETYTGFYIFKKK